jgi:uncharacterized membrane protein YcaP (DUF421 family)
LLRHNMRREFTTHEELLSQLRLQGINDVTQVRAAYLEADGRISVLDRDGQARSTPERHPNRADEYTAPAYVFMMRNEPSFPGYTVGAGAR